MFQKRILKAGVTASAIQRSIAIFCSSTQTLRGEPNEPLKMVAYTCSGFSPVIVVVIMEHTMSASRIAAARMPQDLYQGRASRFVMWKRGDLVFLFMALSSQLSHHHADLALFRAAAGDDAADLAAAQNKYSVAQLKKHVKILTDVDNGNALLLLAVY